MRELQIINIIFCTLITALTSCSGKTVSENTTKTIDGSQTSSVSVTNIAEQTTENTTDQTTSVIVTTENETTDNTSDIFEFDPHKIDRLSLGGSHTGFVTEDGSLYVWGCGFEYQLGNNEHSIAESPIKIMDDVKCVSLGSYHTAVIKNDNTCICGAIIIMVSSATEKVERMSIQILL